MKNKAVNLEKLSHLSTDSIEKIEKQNEWLKQNAGASLSITNVKSDTVFVEVKNINGKRTPKAELLNSAYKIMTENLPENYRVSIIL